MWLTPHLQHFHGTIQQDAHIIGSVDQDQLKEEEKYSCYV